MKIKGVIISGEYGKIIARQKSTEEIELGELLIAEAEQHNILLQVYELVYGSQISQQNLELISGMKLEDDESIYFHEQKLRNYKLMFMKALLSIPKRRVQKEKITSGEEDILEEASACKTLPSFFGEVREITKSDLAFLQQPEKPMYIGNLRTGSKLLDLELALPGDEVLAHHVLVAAATGKGKSNLTKVMLWNLIDKNYCGMLILDPHDEYFGRTALGLKDHPLREKVVYYTAKNPPIGARTLKINLKSIKPEHFQGVTSFSQPQKELLHVYYKKYGNKWIESIILEEQLSHVSFNEATLSVVKRRLLSLLNLDWNGSQLSASGIFDLAVGETTVKDIVNSLEQSKKVIVDTAHLSSAVEILVGGMVAEEILCRYQQYKTTGELERKPVISILLEEAPRVLGKDVLEEGSNIFDKIAREGRKFKVGLFAITQLPSLIPRTILANINTKIILGMEMAVERQALIESASQDLSSDNRSIASLDKGEAIISSTFTRFAIPIKCPLFQVYIRQQRQKKLMPVQPANTFMGVKT